jgi:hypothetical protein
MSSQVPRSYEQDVEPEDSARGAPRAAPEVIPAISVRGESPPGERAALAIAVAKSNANLGALETSLRYYRMALNGNISGTVRAEVTGNIRGLQALIRRDANNARRMPVIHRDIDQDRSVRPRLVAARQAPPPANSDRRPKGGSAQ